MELVTAENGNALYDYLTNKGLKVQKNAISIFDSYIGKEYSFVVAWINVLPYHYYEPYSKKVGIFITFPINKVFYPLLPTSIYGNKFMPINIYLLGYFEPKVCPEIKGYIKTSYYVQDYFSTGLSEFFGSTTLMNLAYTNVEIRAPSKYFVRDLYFEESHQAKFFSFIVSHQILVIFVVMFISAVAGSIAGFIVYRKIKKVCINRNGKYFYFSWYCNNNDVYKNRKKL